MTEWSSSSRTVAELGRLLQGTRWKLSRHCAAFREERGDVPLAHAAL
jgi:hypothetical protein